MATKKKAAGVRSRAAFNTDCKRNRSLIRSRAKAAIVRLALWGLLPFKLAEWIIRRGGMRDV